MNLPRYMAKPIQYCKVKKYNKIKKNKIQVSEHIISLTVLKLIKF